MLLKGSFADHLLFLSLSHSLPPSLSFPWLNSEIAGQIIGLQSWVRLEAERVVGRVGKELSTSRVVAGQTLLVGAANISLTPWQTNLTFVRASPLCRLPLLFTLRLPFPYWRDWLFLSYKTARCFPKFPTFSSFSSSSRVPLYEDFSEKKHKKKKKKKGKKEKRRKDWIPKHRHQLFLLYTIF